MRKFAVRSDPFERTNVKQLATFAGAASLCLGAAAQSSITLYGVVDVGVRHVDNGDASLTSLASNGNNTSRIGLKGIEDLGGGLKAGFQLESGLNPDTGTTSDATRFWNRRSTLSLIGGLGELRAGRDYSVTYLGYEDYDVWSDIGLSSVGKFDSSLGTVRDTAVRSDNQLVYFTPATLGGFYGRLGYAPGEGIDGKRYVAARAGYAKGPLDVSATVGQTNVAPVDGHDKFKTFDVGAAYDFGVARVSSYYQRSEWLDLKVANAYVGLQVPVGPGLVRASYIDSNLSGRTHEGVSTDANDAHQLALGYLYNFTKRTALYTNIAHVVNKGASAIAVDKNPTLLAGRNSTGYDLGMRHSF
jgi:predicted porin